MKKEEIVLLDASLRTTGALPGLKFAFVYANNKRVLDKAMASIRKEQKAVKDQFKHLNKITDLLNTERDEIIFQHAKKDEEGKRIRPQSDDDIEDTVALKKALDKFAEENKAKFEEVEKGEKERDELLKKILEEDMKIDLQMIKKEDCPETINGEQLKGIHSIIEQ